MEETIRIESIRWYPRATAQQLLQHKEDLRSQDSPTLILLPAPEDQDYFLGLLLEKYFTPQLEQCTGVRGSRTDGEFHVLQIGFVAIRGFIGSLMRKMQFPNAPKAVSEPSGGDMLKELEDLARQQAATPNVPRFGSAHRFLRENTPASIQKKLDEYVIGQKEVTRAVAEFLYYHALRQQHPQLPQRPLLITGPSGSGKTEVWRIANQLYGSIFPIKIIDGSNLSCEGWSGNYKLDTYIDATTAQGGILVVDEFDKLAKPKHSGSGDNVSLDMQSEFLKLMEGEYQLTEKRKQTNLTTKKMGFVLVGAFESLRARKVQKHTPHVQPIGFCAATPAINAAPVACSEALTDEDFIAYGIMPEIVGRIAVKCASKALPDSAYLDILRGPHSRVGQLEQVLESYGISVSQVISSEELIKLVRTSKSNHTGVRWVSAQVESRLLEAIYEKGLFPHRAAS